MLFTYVLLSSRDTTCAFLRVHNEFYFFKRLSKVYVLVTVIKLKIFALRPCPVIELIVFHELIKLTVHGIGKNISTILRLARFF